MFFYMACNTQQFDMCFVVFVLQLFLKPCSMDWMACFFVQLVFCVGGKTKVRNHQVVGSLALFVDVLNFVGVVFTLVIELSAISFRYS